jgi:tetratricopeptide (TPR) repeat protein
LIRLGAFELEHPIGKGGMGQVWAANAPGHRPLAIKVLTGRVARDPAFIGAFRNEVRAAASLDHPNVVVVYDYGESDGEAERQSRGAIPSGTPFLAMERVDGSTLAPLCGRLAWWEIRSVLEQLLAALAHAHARGVVHRDVKPANVLVTRSQGAIRVKLTDFGLAHALDGAEDMTLGGGTPSFMAPEQFTGTWRDFGPWTDLYALGCVVWSLVRGQPPFGASRSSEERRHQHLKEPLPPLHAGLALPPGFEDWVRRLLAKDPHERYRRAADAAWGLRMLGDPSEELVVPDTELPSQADTLVVTAKGTGETTLVLPSSATANRHPAAGPDDPTGAVPPLPVDWREPDRRFEAAGAGLFGLRVVPLVDREAERDALWAALGRVSDHGRTELVILSGPAGSGKSRLAQWLCERADEVGGAVPARAGHGPVASAAHGLGGMLGQLLQCQNLPRAEVAARVEAIYRNRGVRHPDEWQAITELISPARQGEAGLRFGTDTERYIPIRRFLRLVCAERPAILWFDDVQWGSDALGLAAHLLEGQVRHPLPVLIVVTATDEALVERVSERERLAALARQPGVSRMVIGPLQPEHRAQLVRNLLGLEGELAREIEERTGGNPLFAVQLVGDWVERGVLERGTGGYRLKRGVEMVLPADVHAVWADRVARLLAGRPLGQVMALELAAALGTEVNTDEWECVCARATADPAESLVDSLLDQRLAIADAHGPSLAWSFAHAMLRETLEEQARRGGRLTSHHLHCAEELATRPRPGQAQRVAHHWLLAGRQEMAIEPLFQAASERVAVGDFATGEALMTQRDAAMAATGVAASDPAWGEGWLLRHDLARRQGRLAESIAVLDRAERAADDFGWINVRIRALVFRARAARWRGDAKAAFALALGAEARSRDAGDRRWIGQARVELAIAAKAVGELEDAALWIRRARPEFEATADLGGLARCYQVLGQVLKQAGRHREAAVKLEQAERVFEGAGQRLGMALSMNSRADVLRFSGDLEGATMLYRRARGLLRTVGAWEWVYPELNLAHVQIARGELSDAEEVLESLMAEFERLGNRAVLADLHMGLALCAADTGRWIAWDDHLREAWSQLAATSWADEDTARLADLAGERALRAGEPVRALDAFSLARGQWRALGRTGEAAASDARMRASEAPDAS